MSETRQAGYYWVKYKGKWIIALMKGNLYFDLVVEERNGNSSDYLEDFEYDEFDEIGERILSPDENVKLKSRFEFVDTTTTIRKG